MPGRSPICWFCTWRGEFAFEKEALDLVSEQAFTKEFNYRV
jgi:hypothetical protein